MFTRRVHRRLTAWLAALALLCSGLLPVLSHAVVASSGPGQGWVEVCTVSGMAWVQQADGDADSSGLSSTPGTDLSMARCDWCATHSPTTGLPPVAASALVLPLAGTDVPPAFLHAPRPLFVWASAHSRAPPLSA